MLETKRPGLQSDIIRVRASRYRCTRHFGRVLGTVGTNTTVFLGILYQGHPENVLETVKWKLIMAVE